MNSKANPFTDPDTCLVRWHVALKQVHKMRRLGRLINRKWKVQAPGWLRHEIVQQRKYGRIALQQEKP